MGKKKDTDTAAEEAAYTRMKARIDAVSEADAQHLGANYDDATSRALAVEGALAEDPSIEERLRLIDTSIFDHRHLADFPVLIRAVIYANDRSKTVEATTSEAMVPLRLVVEASARRGRMLRLAEYFFRDHPTRGPEVASIRAGSGHLDLASDLVRLAALLSSAHDEVKRDTVNYDAEDLARARPLAMEIRAAYHGATKNAWAGQADRAFALLDDCYDEIRTAAQYVYRKSPATLELFPALRSGGRKRGGGGAGAPGGGPGAAPGAGGGGAPPA